MNLKPLLLMDALRARVNAEGIAEVAVGQLAGTLGGISDRQVQRLLRDLETSGRITAINKGGGRGKPSQYRIEPASSDAQRVTSLAAKGDTQAERVTQDVTLSGQRVTSLAAKGDAQPERVTPDVTLSPPLPPGPPTPPISPSLPLVGDGGAAEGDAHRPQNLTVSRVRAVYRQVGAEAPPPSIALMWAKSIGETSLLELLEELAGQGHLAQKPQAYVHACVRSRRDGSAPGPRRLGASAAGVDPRRLGQAARLAGRRSGGDAA